MAMAMAMTMSIKASPELLLLLSLFLLPGLAVSGQEVFEVTNLDQLPPPPPPPSSSTSSEPPIPIALGVAEADLPLLSGSTTSAEWWVKTRVHPHLASTNITTLLVGKGVLCSPGRQHLWGLVFPCALNLHYSLLKLGLLGRTRVALSFSSDCLAAPDHHDFFFHDGFKHDLVDPTLRPLLGFLRDSHSIYSIGSSTPSTPHLAVASHRSALEKLGFGGVEMVGLKEAEERVARRLSASFVVASSPYAYPDKPKPTEHFVAPAKAPDGSFSSVPVGSPDSPPPTEVVSGNPFGRAPLPPPCTAVQPVAAAPSPSGVHVEERGLWCVAKPTVPSEKLEAAMDYACGEGGADCEQIGPNGSCYFPDNVVAHASYAFNSYWQKNKRQGGSCGFGGTAMLIVSDPSYQDCRFVLN